MKHKTILAIIVTAIILSLVAVVATTNSKVELHQIELKTKQQEVDLLQQKLETNEQTKAENQKELDKKLKENQELQREIERLQAKKAEEARIAQANASNAVSASPQTATGDWVAQCHAWAKQAGIVLNDAAIQLLQRESHCSPTAQNPTSPACGIAQNINGCGGADYGYDPITQLIWFHNYCQSRYGGFDGALAHSLANNWY